MDKRKYLLVIGGPTASGKTRFAIELARHYRTHILSADSRQFYREMAIGTAKPTAGELAEAPHHFVGHLSIEERYSVGAFEQDAINVLKEIYKEKQLAVLVGGSGLYLKAVCEGLNEFPEVSPSIKEEIEETYQQKGLEYLQAELAAADPIYYEQVDRNNPHRLMRALAVCRASGKPFSSFREKDQKERFFIPVFLQLNWPRSQLYGRINQRVDQMMAAGLEEEARSLYKFRAHTALQTVGYQELFDFFEGKANKEDAIELIKRNSRRYAKRQLTWYRRDGHWKLFRPEETGLAIQYIEAVKDKGLGIQYRTLEQKPLPIHADKQLLLEIKAEGSPTAGIYLYMRKKESLAVIEEMPPSLPQPEYWTLHELALANRHRSLYIFTTDTLNDRPEWIKLERVPIKNIPSWMMGSWKYLNEGEREYKVYAVREIPLNFVGGKNI